MLRISSVVLACATSLGAAAAATSNVGANGEVYEVLHKFSKYDGQHPYAGVIADADGNLYGATVTGGSGDCRGGCGAIFKIAPDGTETILYSFNYAEDGAWPYGGLLRDSAGNLYGVASVGGSKACTGGCGTLFRLAPDGTYTVLHAFQGGRHDGSEPTASLIADAAGNLYGTTNGGGSSDPEQESGTAFRLAPDGTFTLLHAFNRHSDGHTPQASLVMDATGNLYGTTVVGGRYDRGTVFRLTPDGTETVLHSFGKGAEDGTDPSAGLIIDNASNLYGTTSGGGASKNCIVGCGTVFEVTADGSERVIHAFSGEDGSGPNAGLVADGAGNLYGTTIGGGSSNKCFCGVVFRIRPDGKASVVYPFDGKRGANSFANLLLGADGNLYGTTAYGGRGRFGDGAVFSLKK